MKSVSVSVKDEKGCQLYEGPYLVLVRSDKKKDYYQPWYQVIKNV